MAKLNVNLDTATHTALKTIAAENQRSLRQIIEFILMDYVGTLDNPSLLPPKKSPIKKTIIG